MTVTEFVQSIKPTHAIDVFANGKQALKRTEVKDISEGVKARLDNLFETHGTNQLLVRVYRPNGTSWKTETNQMVTRNIGEDLLSSLGGTTPAPAAPSSSQPMQSKEMPAQPSAPLVSSAGGSGLETKNALLEYEVQQLRPLKVEVETLRRENRNLDDKAHRLERNLQEEQDKNKKLAEKKPLLEQITSMEADKLAMLAGVVGPALNGVLSGVKANPALNGPQLTPAKQELYQWMQQNSEEEVQLLNTLLNLMTSNAEFASQLNELIAKTNQKQQENARSI